MRTRSLRLLVATLAVAALGAPATAHALSPTSSPLPGSTFQGGDGDQANPAGDVSSPPDGIADVDWQGITARVTTASDNNLSDSTYAGGNKESEPDKWDLTATAGGVTPGKANILAAWSATEPTTSDTFLYFAFRRGESSGNTFLTFELNQRTDTWVNSVGETIPCRTTGDVLISYEVASGGTPPNVDVVLYRWTSTTTDAATGCGKTGTLTNVNPSATQAQGAVNAATITNYLDPLTYGSSFGAGTFGEAAINLTAILGGAGNPCFSFGQIQMHSRSSTAIDSALQDFVSPVPAISRSCAVEGRKYDDRNGDGDDESGDADAANDDPPLAGWQFYVDYDDDGVRDANEPTGTTGADGRFSIGAIANGTWKLREVLQSGWQCTQPAQADAHGCYYSFTATTGNQTGFVFGNVDRPTITIAKQTEPDGSSQEFDFTSAVAALGAAQLADGETATATVAPGTYTVSEDAASGWDLTGLACTGDADSSGDQATRTATFRVTSGEDVTCTFTNTQRGSITIEKQTDPNGSAQEFDFTSGDVGAFDAAQLADGESAQASVAPGTYAVSEDALAGWDLTALECSDAAQADDDDSNVDLAGRTATFDVQPGESVTCTFTNTQRGSIAIEKQTDPNGSSQEFDFSSGDVAAFDSAQLADGESAQATVVPGSYAVSEDAVGGWDLTALECSDAAQADDDDSNVDLAGRTATFDVQPGETVTCVFTNTQRGSIAIEKQTEPNGSSQEFDFTSGDVAGFDSAQLADGESAQASVAPGTYAVSEDAASGWDLTALECSDAAQGDADDSNTDLGGRTATFDVQPGETVTCVFTNTQRGSITIEKQTDPNGSNEEFDFTSGDVAAFDSAQLADGETAQASVAPGTYVVSEDSESGWDLTALACSDDAQGDDDDSNVDLGSRTATFDVQPGEAVTCVFTNTQRGSIAIEKQTDPNGSSQEFDFSSGDVAAFDSAQLADGESAQASVAPGTYAVSEDALGGWDLTALACSDDAQGDADDSNVDLAGRTATFDVQPGEAVTCVFTNTQRGSISIEKQTDPNGSSQEFDFTSGDVAAFDAAQLADGETAQASVAPGTYAVSEDALGGWDLTALACSDDAQGDADDSNVDLGGRTATFDVQPGETVTCVFTNTQRGSITIEKQTDPNGSNEEFDFTSADVAAFDSAELADGESAQASVAPGTYAVSEDAESGWDLSALACSDDAQDDADDSNTDLGGRTATFDVQAGETVTCVFTNTQRGSITIEKQTDPNGSSEEFDFTSADVAAFDSAQLADGESAQASVAPGTYAVSEDAESGWDLSALACSDDAQGDADDSNVDLAGRAATFDVQPGETVTCTFTNTQRATIAIEKQTDPNGSSQEFDFSSSDVGAFDSAQLADGETAQASVVPGTYAVSEDAASGWDLTALECSDATQPADDDSDVDLGARTATFDAQAGETITCTFTNTQRGSISIEKQTDPNGSSQEFDFTSGDVAGFDSAQLADGESAQASVAPGTYAVSEDAASGWDLTALECSDAAQGDADDSNVDLGGRTATFDVQPGESVTCTFTNTQRGSITIEKQTDPNGSSQEFDFTSGDVAGFDSAQLADGESAQASVAPGTYAVSEDAASGWDLTALECSDAAQGDADDSNTDLGGRTATFDVQPGETVTCVFTNTQRGSISIEKQTDPNGSSEEFDFTSADVAAFDSAQLADGESAQASVAPGTYAVSEDAESGWDLTGLACSDAAQDDADDSNTDLGGRTATFDVQPGETVTCVFTNTQRATIAIEKQTDPNGSSEEFDFTSADVAAFDSAELADGESAQATVAPGTYAVAEDSESGWDLTALECSDAPQPADDDSDVDLGARTATFDAQAGETITCTFTNTQRGSISIEKQTDPNGSSAEFDFTSADVAAFDSAQLADGESAQASVAPGTYSVSEDSASGWDLTALACSDDAQGEADDSNVDLGGRTATFDVQPGESVTCTFTNTQRGSIAIEKQTDPNGSAQEFDFTSADVAAFDAAQLADGETAQASVVPGTYSVSEDSETGWQLTGLACSDAAQGDDDDSNVDLADRTATFDVQPGETVTCTFTNTQLARIAIEKQTDPNGSSAEFGFGSADVAAFDAAQLADGETAEASVLPGTYSVTEDAEDGWDLTGLVCSDAAQGDDDDSNVDLGQRRATFDAQAGETVTCTFTNTQRASIAIEKQTDPNGSSEEFDFTSADVAAFDSAQLADGESAQATVAPGTYVVSEDAESGWDLSALACSDAAQGDDDDSNVDLGARRATFDVQPGESVTCTFTNTQRGTIAIEKQTDPNGATQEFDFTSADVAAFDSAQLADGESAQASVAPGTYSAIEDATAGWDLTALACSDAAQGDADDSDANLGARTATFDVQPGESVTCTFTNTQRAMLSGHQFEDLNADGLPREPGDPLMAGWLIWLDLDNDGQLDDGGEGQGPAEPSTETDSEGYYEFANLVPGDYVVRQRTQDGWTCSFPANACHWAGITVASSGRVTVPAGAHVQNLDFGAWRRGSIAGSKFEDANRDGARQSSERPLGGWTFYADLDGDGTRDAGEPSTTSAADGTWELTGLRPGSYTVREEGQDGWTCTAPANCRSTVTVRSGRRADAGEFGNAPPPTPATPAAEEPPPPPPAEPARSTARLTGPDGCVGRPFQARVVGQGIVRVVFFLDGRRIRTLTRPDSRGRWAIRIDPRRLRPGIHRLRAEVRFADGFAPTSRRIRLTFSRCARQTPRFTG